jgi:hypothetical protein
VKKKNDHHPVSPRSLRRATSAKILAKVNLFGAKKFKSYPTTPSSSTHTSPPQSQPFVFANASEIDTSDVQPPAPSTAVVPSSLAESTSNPPQFSFCFTPAASPSSAVTGWPANPSQQKQNLRASQARSRSLKVGSRQANRGLKRISAADDDDDRSVNSDDVWDGRRTTPSHRYGNKEAQYNDKIPNTKSTATATNNSKVSGRDAVGVGRGMDAAGGSDDGYRSGALAVFQGVYDNALMPATQVLDL